MEHASLARPSIARQFNFFKGVVNGAKTHFYATTYENTFSILALGSSFGATEVSGQYLSEDVNPDSSAGYADYGYFFAANPAAGYRFLASSGMMF